MVKPVVRRKSIGTKVSEEESAKLESLAGGNIKDVHSEVGDILLMFGDAPGAAN